MNTAGRTLLFLLCLVVLAAPTLALTCDLEAQQYDGNTLTYNIKNALYTITSTVTPTTANFSVNGVGTPVLAVGQNATVGSLNIMVSSINNVNNNAIMMFCANVVTPATIKCTDSDGGLNYNVKGNVLNSIGGNATDSCTTNKVLSEWSCQPNGEFLTTSYVCAWGCGNGACLPQPPTCYSHLQDLPVSCTGGTITQDSFNGCRTIACGSGANTLKILSCEKPDSNSPQYFEMYKQSQTGSGVKICVGTSCLQNEGYVKSANFPICINTTTPPACVPTTEVCDGKDNNCNGQIDEGNICGLRGYVDIFTNGSIQGWTYDPARSSVPINVTISVDGTKKATFLTNLTRVDVNNAFNITGQHGFGYFWSNMCGQHEVAVDASSGAASLNLRTGKLNWSACPVVPVCGNAIVEAGEQCDDGNTNNGDGCSSTCQIEVPGGCFNNAQTIPVTCTGGTVLNSTVRPDGCRVVWCNFPHQLGYGGFGPVNSSVTLCNKPGDNDPQFMEFAGGYGGEFCAGSVCSNYMNSSGRANFPICQSTCNGCSINGVCYSNGTRNPANECQVCNVAVFRQAWVNRVQQTCNDDGNSCTQNVCSTDFGNSICQHPNEPIGTACDNGGFCNGVGVCSQNSTCYANIVGMPVTCEGGAVTQNTVSSNGCRTLACAGNGNSLQVLACDKPSATSPQYFEMYRQTVVGSGLKICVDGTCLRSVDGFVRSPNYPICNGGNSTPPPNSSTNLPPTAQLTATPNIGSAPLVVNLSVNAYDPEGSFMYFTYFADASSTQILGDAVLGSNGNLFDYNSNGMYDVNDTGILYRAINGAQPCPVGKKCDLDNSGTLAYNDYTLFINFAHRTTAFATYDASMAAKVTVTDTINIFAAPAKFNNVNATTPITIVPSGCFSRLADVPATCTGKLTSDVVSGGCRTLACESADGSVTVLACEKPDGSSSPSYFEMYRQSNTGVAPQLCLGSTCISDNGYARSPNFPICSASATKG